MENTDHILNNTYSFSLLLREQIIWNCACTWLDNFPDAIWEENNKKWEPGKTIIAEKADKATKDIDMGKNTECTKSDQNNK